MSIKTKWHLKEIARTVLSIPFMTTIILLAVIIIRMKQFSEMGLSMYPGIRIPKTYSLEYALGTFWDLSLSPLLLYFIPTLIIDACIRRFVLVLNED